MHEGSQKLEKGLRQCAFSSAQLPKDALLRFVLDPYGIVTPDLKANLPGQSMWLTLDRGVVEKAVAKKLFLRGLNKDGVKITVPKGLADKIDALLRHRLEQALGLAIKSGACVTGFEKVKSALWAGKVGLRFLASDASDDGARKLMGLVGPGTERLQPVTLLNAQTLSLAFGGKNVIHAAIVKGHAADQVDAAYKRLMAFGPGFNE